MPATVSLLCICIAFVPMFGLGGVAGYLFRPLAEAVMLALVASYVLSRTLVPTLANYLLRNQARPRLEPIEAGHGHGQPQSAGALPARLRAQVRRRPQQPIAACCSSLCAIGSR